MRSIAVEEVERRATECGLLFEILDGGTVRVSQPGPPRWVNVQPEDLSPQICPALLIGREAVPPLGDHQSRYRVLRRNRCVLVADGDELRKITRELLKKGVCVRDDAYIFSADGRVLLYVSHHDEMIQWTRT